MMLSFKILIRADNKKMNQDDSVGDNLKSETEGHLNKQANTQVILNKVEEEIGNIELGKHENAIENHAIETCLKILKSTECCIKTQEFDGKSEYYNIESFRKLVIENIECVNSGIYTYIFAFRSEDCNITNRFLEILADFLLATAYSQRNRSKIVLSNRKSLEMLAKCFSKSPCQYNTLVVLYILSHQVEITAYDLTKIISFINGNLRGPSYRLYYRIIANLARHKYKFTREEIERIKNYIEMEYSDGIDTKKDTIAIYEYLDSIITPFTTYLENLKNKKTLGYVDKGFWSQNIEQIEKDPLAFFSLFFDCLSSEDGKLVLWACNDLTELLLQYPTLHVYVMKSGIRDILLKYMEDVNMDLRYSAVRLLSILTYSDLEIDDTYFSISHAN